jgi:hypothetical protein
MERGFQAAFHDADEAARCISAVNSALETACAFAAWVPVPTLHEQNLLGACRALLAPPQCRMTTLDVLFAVRK